MIRTLQALGATDRRIWLYDTFNGMTKPDPIDKHYARTRAWDGGLASWALHEHADDRSSDWGRCSLDETRSTISRAGYPDKLLTYVMGPVEETIPQRAPERISLLRLDTNFYRSTKHELVHLYPRLVPLGILILDDYGAYEGARKAADEYFDPHGEKPLLARVDENVRIAVKPSPVKPEGTWRGRAAMAAARSRAS